MRTRVDKQSGKRSERRIQSSRYTKPAILHYRYDTLRNACIPNRNTTDDHEHLSNSLNKALSPCQLSACPHISAAFSIDPKGPTMTR